LFINEEDAKMELEKLNSNNWRIEIFSNNNGKFEPSYIGSTRGVKNIKT
jgi:hypothetical protein